MRYKEVLLLLPFVLFSFFVTGQTVIDWDEPSGIDDYFSVMSYRSDGHYYGLTKSGLYSSKDGVSWKTCNSHLYYNSAINTDSFLVTSAWEGDISYSRDCLPEDVLPTFYHFYITNEGQPNQVVKIDKQHPTGEMRVNNVGNVLIPFVTSNYYNSPWLAYNWSNSQVLEISPSGETDTLRSDKGEFWVEWDGAKVVLSDSLYFFYDNYVVAKPSPTIDVQGYIGFGATNTSYFVVGGNGLTYSTLDRGDTWILGNINLPYPIKKYFLRKGIHVIYDKQSNVYFSNDFINFQKVNSGDVYFVNDEIWLTQKDRPDLLQFSSDNGQSWTSLYSEGTIANVQTLHVYHDTVYAVTTDAIFRQECGNHFEICLDKPFLSNYAKVIAGETVLQGRGNYLKRYNEVTTSWDILFSGNASHLIDQGDNVFWNTQDSLYMSFDKGVTWSQVALDFNYRSIGIVGDTLVAVSGVGWDCHIYYSLDLGASWAELLLPNIVFDIEQQPVVSVINNTFFISFDKLYGYVDITQPPTVQRHLFDDPKIITANVLLDGLVVQNGADNSFFYYKMEVDSLTEIDLGIINGTYIENIIASPIGHTVFTQTYGAKVFSTSDYYFGETGMSVEEISSCNPIIINGEDYSVSGYYIKPKLDWCDQDTILKLKIAVPTIEIDTTISVFAGDIVAGMIINQDTMFSDTIVNLLGCDSLMVNYSVFVVVSSLTPVEATVTVQPNPVSDQFKIYMNGFQANLIRIIDASGHLFLVQQNDLDIVDLDLRTLTSGSYFLVVENTVRKTKKVIPFQKI